MLPEGCYLAFMVKYPLNFPGSRRHVPLQRPARAALAVAVLALAALACSLPQEILAPPTETPEPSPIATEVPIPTSTSVPTPVPTLPPQERVEAAELALFNGDYELAMREFITTLEVGPGVEVEAAARLGIGRVQWQRGETTNALQSFRDLTERHPGTPQAADAQIFIGLILNDLQRYDEAAAAFQTYLDLQPDVLDAYVYVWMADALRAAGRPEEAAAAYTAALETTRLPGDESRLRMNIAAATAEAGDLNAALEIYTALSESVADETLKPSLLLLRGELLVRLGEEEAGHALYNQAIATYPRAYDSYTALLRLIDAGVPVNELYRGLVDYFVGEHSLAVFAFERHISAAEAEEDGTALF